MALLLVSASINLILTKQEKSRFHHYGRRVSVDGGSMNVWRNGHSGPTMVLLSGLGTAAPGLDFTPLIRQLGAYDVIVVEGFGYGYSDMSSPRPRTVQNITSELRDALTKIAAPKPYILVGHSIAGFYMLSYAHRYPGEVSAVVGIDPTVPAAKAGSTDPSGMPIHALGTALRMSGLVRLAYTLLPDLLGPKGAYTADEWAQMRAMTIWNFGNAAVADEMNRTGSNASALRGIRYPDSLPVLALLASDSVATDQNWVASHEDQLRNVRHHEVVVLNGDHYLHATQSKAMAEKIIAFLDQNLARQTP